MTVPAVTITPERMAWERRDGETAKAWYAFRLYRDMNPSERTLAKVAEKCGYADNSLVERWSRKCSWVSRALAYDEFVDNQNRVRRERERSAASDRRIQIARNMQLVGGAAVQELGKKIQDALKEGNPIPKMTMKDAALLINAGVQIERLESGESTQNVAIEGMILVEDVTKRERELIQIIMEAIRANTEPETARKISEYIDARCSAEHQ